MLRLMKLQMLIIAPRIIGLSLPLLVINITIIRLLYIAKKFTDSGFTSHKLEECLLFFLILYHNGFYFTTFTCAGVYYTPNLLN